MNIAENVIYKEFVHTKVFSMVFTEKNEGRVTTYLRVYFETKMNLKFVIIQLKSNSTSLTTS